MAQLLDQRVVEVVQDALRTATADPTLTVDEHDSMETVAGWDSLAFMAVFTAVNDAFTLDPDFDDAIHYTGLPSLLAYLRQQLG